MEERQVKHFSFRQMRRISTGLRLGSGATGKYSLLCCSNSYGMLFIGGNNSFAVCYTAMLHTVNIEACSDRNKAVPLDQLKPVAVPLPGQPCHLNLSADELTLSVCLREPSSPCMLYDTRSFCEPLSQPARPFAIVNLADASGGVQVITLSWNPAQPSSNFAVCLSDGSVSVWGSQGTSVKRIVKPVFCDAASICWSPKGKQLAVGHRDGRVSQFSMIMELKKVFQAPEILTEKHEVTGLFWLSTYQFALVFTPTNPSAGDDGGLPPIPHFMILTSSKNKLAEFEDFDDIYYGMGTCEPNFLFAFLWTWNILITSSSTASESMVLSKQIGNEVSWEKWNLEDEGRAELPVDGTDDTFPSGMCLDLTSVVPVPIGENNEIPPSPLFILLSDHGLLTPYTVVNTEPAHGTSYDFVCPPKPLLRDGERRAPPPSSVSPSTIPANAATLSSTPFSNVPRSSAPTNIIPLSSSGNIATSTGPQVLGSLNLGGLAKPLPVSKTLLGETILPSSALGRSFSLDRKPTTSSVVFPGAGSLPNLLSTLATSKQPQQPSITPSQRALFVSGSSVTSQPQLTAFTAKTPPTFFKQQPLLSSTPISVAPERTVHNDMSSTHIAAVTGTFVTTMPPPSGRIAGSSVPVYSLPKPVTSTSVAPQKHTSSQAPLTRASAPSPTQSVSSAVEEENVENNLLAKIEDEIEAFSEQLQEHNDDIQAEFCLGDDEDGCLCAVGSEADRKMLVEGQEEMSTKVHSLLDQTKELANTVEGMMDEVLQCRSLYEEAGHTVKMRKSGHYRDYVRKKPISPILQGLLDEVRGQYAVAESHVRELSAQIDADLERRTQQEAIRGSGAQPPLNVPTYHNIYTSLKNNRRTTRLQTCNVDQLVQKMKDFSILPRTWNFCPSSPSSSLPSIVNSDSTRQSQLLMKGVTPVKSAKKKKQPLFKYSPDRLAQLQNLFESSVQSTSMQTVPLLTSFNTSRSSTPVSEDDESDNEVTIGRQQEGDEDDLVMNGPLVQPTQKLDQSGLSPGAVQGLNQPLHGVSPISQPSFPLYPTNQEPLQLGQLPAFAPRTQALQVNSPLNQTALQGITFTIPSMLEPQPKVPSSMGPADGTIPQSHVTSLPPPPPPPSQGHVIHHGSPTTTAYSMSTTTIRSPSEMAAEAAFKRRQDTFIPTTDSLPSAVVTSAPTKTPVVVITASEMPSSSVFFTGKSQASGKSSVTETAANTLPSLFDHSRSVPANFQFQFSGQNPGLRMPPFFTSSTSNQVSLPFSLSTSSGNNKATPGLLSKSETSFSKSTGQAPSGIGLSSKLEMGISKAPASVQPSLAASVTKPSNLVLSMTSSAPTSEPSTADSTPSKPPSVSIEAEEYSTEDSGQSDDEKDETLTTAATISPFVVKSLLSSSMPAANSPVICTATPTMSVATPTIAAVATSVTVCESLVTTSAPPTYNAIVSNAVVSGSTSNVISTNVVTTTTVSAATSLAPPTETSAAPFSSTSVAPPTTTSAAPFTRTSVATPTTTFAAPFTSTSVATPTTTLAAPFTSTSVATPTTASAAPPTTTSAAPFTSTSAAPPTTTSAALFTSTSVATHTTAAPPTIASAAAPTTASLTVVSVALPMSSNTTASSGFSNKITAAPEANNVITTSSAPNTMLLRLSDRFSDDSDEPDDGLVQLDRVASQSSLSSNMTDDINIVDDTDGEMDKEVPTKDTQLTHGFTSLLGGQKTATISMASSNPFGSMGNVSDDGSSSISTGLQSAHTPSVGSGSGLLAPSKFGGGLTVGLGRGIGIAQTGMGVGQTGMGIGQTGMGIGQTGMGVGQTGIGIGQTGMGIGQTGMGGIGSSPSGFGRGAMFGASPAFGGQAGFGTRPMMGNTMGPSTTARVFGSSVQSEGASFGVIAAGGGGQTFGQVAGLGGNQGFGGIGMNQAMGSSGMGITSAATKSSFQGWR